MSLQMEGVKVCIRTRPMIKREAGCEHQWDCDTHQVKQRSNRDKQKSYTFDRVFSDDETTNDVYEEIAEPIIESAMKGFNGTIFAYGQTSSGKTYTMMGSQTNPGIIPLAVNEIFSMIEKTPEREFLLRVSYLEIYNENLKDLLATETAPLSIREDEFKTIIVHGLLEEMVTSPKDVMRLMERGERNRQMAATNMNERSSRSHTIFRMIIESRERGDPNRTQEEAELAVKVSHLNLVDLAGSERASQTGAEGQRLKEGCYINKSLMILGQVINQICKESESGSGTVFKSFRDSKLTRILQSSLGGNSLTAIVCTVTLAVVDETESTLRFASSAKQVTNKPIMNEVLSDEALLIRQKREINKLKKRIEEMEKQKDQQGCVDNLLAEKELLQDKNQKLTRMLLVSSLPPDYAKRQQRMRRETWCPGARGNSLQVGWHATPPKANETLLTDFSINQSTFISDLDMEERSLMFKTPHALPSKRAGSSEEQIYPEKKTRFLETSIKSSDKSEQELQEKLQMTEKILDDVKTSKDFLEQERNELLEKIAELEVDLEDMKKENEKQHSNTDNEHLKTQISQLQGQIRMMESAISESLSEQATHEEEKAKLRATIDKLSDQVVTLERRDIERSNSNSYVNGLKAQIEDLECQLRNACHEKRCIQEQCDDETDRSYNLSMSVEKLNKQLGELQSEADFQLSEYKEKVNVLQTQLEASLSATKSPDYSAKLESQIATLKMELQMKSENSDEMQKMFDELQCDFKNSMQKYEETIKDLQGELRIAKESPKADSVFGDVPPQPSFTDEKIKCLEEAIQQCEQLIEEKCSLELQNQQLSKECSEKQTSIENLKQRTLSQETKISELLEQAEFDRTEKQVLFEEEKNWTQTVAELQEKLKQRTETPGGKQVKELEFKISDLERNSADAQILLHDANQKLSQSSTEIELLKECKKKLEKELEIKQADLESYMTMLDISKPSHYAPMQRSFVEQTEKESDEQEALVKEFETKFEKQEQELKAVIEANSHQVEELNQKCQGFETQMKELLVELQESQKAKQKYEQELSEVCTHKGQFAAKIEELTEELQNSKADFEQLKHKLQEIEDRSVSDKQEHEKAKQSIHESLSGQLEQQIATIDNLKEQLETKEKTCLDLKESMLHSEKELNDLKKAKEEDLNKLTYLQNQVNEYKNAAKNERDQVQNDKLQIDQLNEKIHGLEDQVRMLNYKHEEANETLQQRFNEDLQDQSNKNQALLNELEQKKKLCHELQESILNFEKKMDELEKAKEEDLHKLTNLQSQIDQHRMFSEQDETDQVQNDKLRIEQLNEKIYELEDQVKMLNCKHNEENENVQERFSEELQEQTNKNKALQNELKQKEKLCHELQESIENFEKEVDDLKRSKEEDLHKLTDLQTQTDQHQTQDTTEPVQNNQLHIDQLNQKIHELKDQVAFLQAKSEESEENLQMRLNEDMQKQVSVNQALHDDLQCKEKLCNELQEQMLVSENKIVELTSAQEEHMEQLSILKIQMESKQNNFFVDELKEKLASSRCEVDELQRRLQELVNDHSTSNNLNSLETTQSHPDDLPINKEQSMRLEMLEEELKSKTQLCFELQESNSNSEMKINELVAAKEELLQQVAGLHLNLKEQEQKFAESSEVMKQKQDNMQDISIDATNSSIQAAEMFDKTIQHTCGLSQELDEARSHLELEKKRHTELQEILHIQKQKLAEKDGVINNLQEKVENFANESQKVNLQLLEAREKLVRLSDEMEQKKIADDNFKAVQVSSDAENSQQMQELQVLYSQLQMQMEENSTNLARLEDEKVKLTDELELQQLLVNEITTENATLEQSVAEMKENVAASKVSLNEKEELIKELEMKCGNLQATVSAFKEEGLAEKYDDLHQKHMESLSDVENRNKEIDLKLTHIEELQGTVSTMSRENNSLKENIEELKNQISIMECDKATVKEQASIAVSKASNEVTHLEQKIVEQENKIKTMTDEHGVALEEFAAKREVMQTKLVEADNLKVDYEMLQQNLETEAKKNTELKEKNRALESEVEALNNKHKDKELDTDKISSMEEEVGHLKEMLSSEKKLVDDKNSELQNKASLLDQALAQIEDLRVKSLSTTTSEVDHKNCVREIDDLKDLLDVSALQLRRSQDDREHLEKLLKEREEETEKLRSNHADDLSSLNDLLVKKEADLKAVTADKDSMQEDAKSLQSEVASLQIQLRTEKEKSSSFESQVKDMQRCMSDDRAPMFNALQEQKHLSDAEKNFVVLYEEFTKLTEKCSLLESDLNSSKLSSENVSQALSHKETLLTELQQELVATKKEKWNVEQQNKHLSHSQQEMDTLQTEYKLLLKDFEMAKADLSEKTQSIEGIRKSLESKDCELKQATEQLKSKSDETTALGEQLQSAREDNLGKAKKIAKLQCTCNELESVKNEMNALKQNLDQKMVELKTQHLSNIEEKEQVNVALCEELEAVKKALAKSEKEARQQNKELVDEKQKLEMALHSVEVEKQTLLHSAEKLQNEMKNKDLQISDFDKQMQIQQAEFQSRIDEAIELSKQETNNYIKSEEARLNEQLRQQVESFKKYKQDLDAKTEECVKLQSKLKEMEKRPKKQDLDAKKQECIKLQNQLQDVEKRLKQEKENTVHATQTTGGDLKHKNEVETNVPAESSLANSDEVLRWQTKYGALRKEYFQVCKEVEEFEEETAQLKETVSSGKHEMEKLRNEMKLLHDTVSLQQSSQIQVIARREIELKAEEAKLKVLKDEVEQRSALVKQIDELKLKLQSRTTEVLCLETKLKFLQRDNVRQGGENQDLGKAFRSYALRSRSKLKSIDQNVGTGDVGVQTDAMKSIVVPGGVVQLTKLDMQEKEMMEMRKSQHYLEKELAKYKDIEHVRRGENQTLLDENKSLRAYVHKAKQKLKTIGSNAAVSSEDACVQTDEDSPGECKNQ